MPISKRPAKEPPPKKNMQHGGVGRVVSARYLPLDWGVLRHTFSKVSLCGAFVPKCTRALTFENVCLQGAWALRSFPRDIRLFIRWRRCAATVCVCVCVCVCVLTLRSFRRDIRLSMTWSRCAPMIHTLSLSLSLSVSLSVSFFLSLLVSYVLLCTCMYNECYVYHVHACIHLKVCLSFVYTLWTLFACT